MFFDKKINPEQMVLWIKQNFKKILWISSFSALAVLVFIGWSQWEKNQERQIQDSLYELQKSLKELVEKSGEKTKEKSLDLLKNSDPKGNPVFSQEMKEKARFYEEAIKQNQKRRAAIAFSVDLADFYYRRGEKDKAKELLALFAFPDKSSNGYHLASFQLASYYMDAKECEKALAILSHLNRNPKALYFHLESELQQAICLEHLNRYDQALHKYEAVINKDPQGYTGRLAQDYKKLLVLSRNLKKEE